MRTPVPTPLAAKVDDISIFTTLLLQSMAEGVSQALEDTTEAVPEVVPGGTMDLEHHVPDASSYDLAVVTNPSAPPPADSEQVTVSEELASSTADANNSEGSAASGVSAEKPPYDPQIPSERQRPDDMSVPAPIPTAPDTSPLETLNLGPAMVARLKLLGINDAADVANADADTLRQELGEISRLVDVASWIARARSSRTPA
jgi:hypothetical protein